MATEAARCTSIKVTPSGGAELTAVFPISCAPIYDDEVIEKQYSDSRQKSVYGGAEVKGLRFTCCDTEIWAALKKGTRVTSAVVKVEAAKDVDGTDIVAGDILTHTLSGGYVKDAVEAESTQDGAPMEYTFYVELCRAKSTGTEGTLVSVFSTGGGGD